MRTLSALTIFLLLAAPLGAQQTFPSQTGEELVDRVVAVVGDTVLLLSDIQSDIQQLEMAGRLPPDPVQRAAVERDLMQSRIDELLLLQAAEEAGITVQEDRVQELVEQNMTQVRRQFPSEQSFLAALQTSGRTLDQYRQELAQQLRAQQMIDQFRAQRLRNRARPLVSEEQIRSAFDVQRAALGQRPATVSLQQVVIEPQPTDSAKAAARREAEQVLKELQEGGDFEVLARRFSDDPGSKERGGSLGWYRQGGGFVPEFEQMAFALRPGVTSPIVESQFGYHIIKVDKVRGPERQIRHILVRPEVTAADIQRARERADSVAQAVRSGASVPVLARQYKTPEDQIELVNAPLDRLPQPYFVALQGEAQGAVVGPFELQQGPAGSQWAVVKVTNRREAGEYTLEDVREQLRQRLEEQAMTEDLVEELRRQIHVAVRQ